MHLSSSQKAVLMVLRTGGIVFRFFSWAMLCNVILCLVVLLTDQSDETNLRYPSRYCEEICRCLQHTVAGTVRENFFAKFFLLRQQARNSVDTNLAVFHLLVDPTLHNSSFCCHLPDCHSSIFSYELIHFPFCLNRGHSRATTTAPNGDGNVPALKMLFPSSDTASAQARVSLCTLTS